ASLTRQKRQQRRYQRPPESGSAASERRFSRRFRTVWTPTLPSPKTDGEGIRKFQIDDHRAHPRVLFGAGAKCYRLIDRRRARTEHQKWKIPATIESPAS